MIVFSGTTSLGWYLKDKGKKFYQLTSQKSYTA